MLDATKEMLAYYVWISAQPRVLLLSETGTAARVCLECLAPEPVHCLLQFSHWQAPRVIAQLYRDWLAARPQDRVTVLINDTATYAEVFRSGVPCRHISTSSFLDFELAVPHPQREKRSRAFYAARYTPMKRHELAAKVQGAVFAGWSDPAWDPADYIATVAELCPHAITLGRMTPQEIPLLLSESYVGLLLSALEGASRAAAEYQLCGLPVVTTAPRGGCMDFLVPSYTTVARTPDEIATAVDFWNENPPDPYAVRTAVLRRLLPHRLRFINLVQRIFDETQVGRVFPSLWQSKLVFSRQCWAARDCRYVEQHLIPDTEGSADVSGSVGGIRTSKWQQLCEFVTADIWS